MNAHTGKKLGSLSAKWMWICFFCALTVSQIGAQTSLPTYEFKSALTETVHFNDSLHLFSGEEQQALIAHLQALLPSGEKLEAGGVWSAVQLANTSRNTQRALFRFCQHAGMVRLYVLQEDRLIERQINGREGVKREERLPSAYHFAWTDIPPGQEQRLYFQVHYPAHTTAGHETHLSMMPYTPTINQLINRLSWQSFYAGLLLLLCVVGWVMHRMFRERAFLYLAGMMFCAALYFADRYGLTRLLTDVSYPTDTFPLMVFAISGIVLFTSFFLSAFLQLEKNAKAYHRIYRRVSVFTAVSPYLFMVLFDTPAAARATFDLLLLIWALLCTAPVVWLARRGQSAGRSLLLPFGLLVLGSILFLLGNALGLSDIWLINHGFQLSLLLFSGLLFFVLFERVDKLRKSKQRFEELDRLKSRFFTNISHEFRTPLTLMMGPLQQLMEGRRSPEEKQLLQVAYRNADRQLRLVNELLDLSRLEAGKMALKAGRQDVVPFAKSLVYAYESLAMKKSIALTFQSEQPQLELFFDAPKLEKVLNNLVSNALKFTPEEGRVSVSVGAAGQEAYIRVADTGPGIAPEHQARVFDRFFQADENPQLGSGVGLAIARELVRLHHGRITLDSEVGKGTVFTVFLPRGRRHLKAGEWVENPAGPAGIPAPLPESDQPLVVHENTPDAARVLLVEDNPEVRAFIKQLLSASFQVLEAENGEAGIQIALQEMPDLIVSDVMMPRKNGYEVCATLKADVRTSHIPVILLTAKAEQEEKLQGLKTGADDYLAKPFDAEELLLRIRNLIRLRQQLRERFATAVELKPSEVSANSVDQEFLKRALQIVEKHLDDEQFSVEVLAREIGMSRPNLNRKLRALLNQSTNQFIQSVRLQRAAELLRQQSGGVSEIAFQTGFRSTAYFIKCFKDKFGDTPGSYAQKAREA